MIRVNLASYIEADTAQRADHNERIVTCPSGQAIESSPRGTSVDPQHEVKKFDDGWAWRCWLCGWHGVGLVSEAGARKELAEHPCEPN